MPVGSAFEEAIAALEQAFQELGLVCPPKFLELLQDAIPNRENFEDHFETALFNTMPEKEELAISKVAYVILPWQVERVLHIKFPGEVSRAQEAGFGYYVKLEEIAVINF